MQFIGIGVVVGRDALRHLWLHQAPEQGALLCIIAALSMMVLTALALAKWQLAVRGQPGSLALSAKCDGCSKTSSGSIGPSTVFQVKMNTCPIKGLLQGWRFHCSLIYISLHGTCFPSLISIALRLEYILS